MLGVQNATLDVGEGEIMVLMGLSGSGKSTLLRAVNGLNPVGRAAASRSTTASKMVEVARCDADEASPPPLPPRRHGVPAVRAAALADRR